MVANTQLLDDVNVIQKIHTDGFPLRNELKGSQKLEEEELSSQKTEGSKIKTYKAFEKGDGLW